MAVRSSAAPADAVTGDARARRLVTTVMLVAVALGHEGIGIPAAAWRTMSDNIRFGDYQAAEKRAWLAAAGIALMTATLATRPRPNLEATT